MSNIIDNLLINEGTTTSNTSSVTGQTNKDKPSLFDSLLSNISNTEEVKVNNTTTVKTEVKDVASKLEEINLTDNIELVDNIDVKDLESVKIETGNKEQNLPSSSSLLDKLIIEAKKNIKETDSIVKESIKLDAKMEKNTSSITIVPVVLNSELSSSVEIDRNDIKVEETNKLENKIQNSVTLNIDVKESENLDLIKNEEVKTGSLLDRLIIEAKKDSKSIVIDEIKEVVELDNKVENRLDTKEAEVKTTPIDSLVEKINPIENIVPIMIKEENKLDTKEVEVKTIPTDFLVERPNPIENIIPVIVKVENKLDTKEVEVKTTPIDSLVEKINPTENIIPVIVKEENKLDTKEAEVKITPIDSFVEKTNPIETILPAIVKEDKEVLNTISKERIVDKIILDQTLVVTSNLVDLKSTDKSSLNTSNIPVAIVSEEVISEENKIDTLTIKKDEKLSLMDQLIQKNTEKLTLDTISNNQFDSSLKEVVTKDLISSIYLGSQKNKINSQSLFNKNEAVAILKDGNSIQAVKTSAEMLDLGLEEATLDQSLVVEKSDLKLLNKKSLIENIFLEKNVKSEEIKGLITKSVEASNALIENSINLASDVTVNVNSPISYNIQSKIIGAKQQMSAMMSDIAKQMYENYKPPVTAFKINLNPTELGSIAILMKSDRNSGLSISMNVSNNVTLETLIENQNVLKNSLNKTFDDSTKFNLDFSSSNQNNSNQSSSNNQSNNRQFEQQMGTQEVLKLKEENKDTEEKVTDYM